MPSGGQREELQPSQTDLSAGSFELTGTSHQCLLYLTFSVFLSSLFYSVQVKENHLNKLIIITIIHTANDPTVFSLSARFH